MLLKKYKIIYKVWFERVKSYYAAPCISCRLYTGDKFLCKGEFNKNNLIFKSTFDLCIKASNHVKMYNYKAL